MDLLTCICLAAIEAKVITVLSPAVLSTEVWPFMIWNAVSLFLLQYFALKYYRIWVYPRYFFPLRYLPGLMALHLLWNLDAPVIRYFSFANTEVLVVNSIQAHKALLQTHYYNFRKPDTLRRMVKEIPIFLRVARQLGGVFNQAIGYNTRDAVDMVDCRKAFSRATLEIIAEIALGIEFGYTFHHTYNTFFTQSFAGNVLLESPDFLTYLVTENRPGGPAEGISEDELVGHSIYVLATKQDIQSKFCAKVAELLPHAVDFTAAELDSLPYLDSFMKEIFRLYSPATLMYRQAEVDVHLDGVFVPKGTTVEIVPSVTMRNPHIWGEDVDVVDPSRWNRLTGDQHSPYAFEAFSNGPRICIGRSFALLEIKTIVVEMVRRYRFLYVAKPFSVGNPSLILRPTGLEVAVQKVGKQSNS
ncbi:cytochrome P450 [Hypoxylon rubiginosum]|uniref:Cytochrome P450 n=1 Tax=Hypoxylon rubiginosum TaxID=110542 RepID=A0ACC0CIM6_9PEZI|nr:cytochrome P450 [Hypoxylon rubiginosum]